MPCQHCNTHPAVCSLTLDSDCILFESHQSQDSVGLPYLGIGPGEPVGNILREIDHSLEQIQSAAPTPQYSLAMLTAMLEHLQSLPTTDPLRQLFKQLAQ